MLHYWILIQIQTGVGGLAIFNQHWHLWCFTAGSGEHSSSSSLLPLPQRVQAGQPTHRGGAGHNILKLWLLTSDWYCGDHLLLQVKIAQRIGLIQHLPTGTFDGCKKNREWVFFSRLELLQCPQVCHLHDWVQCGGLCALPALHAYLPCGGNIKS